MSVSPWLLRTIFISCIGAFCICIRTWKIYKRKIRCLTKLRGYWRNVDDDCECRDVHNFIVAIKMLIEKYCLSGEEGFCRKFKIARECHSQFAQINLSAWSSVPNEDNDEKRRWRETEESLLRRAYEARSGSSRTKGGEGQPDEAKKETGLDRSIGAEEKRARKERERNRRESEDARWWRTGNRLGGRIAGPPAFPIIIPRFLPCPWHEGKVNLVAFTFAMYRHARTFITLDINPRWFIVTKEMKFLRERERGRRSLFFFFFNL